jgi:hypothetical protein
LTSFKDFIDARPKRSINFIPLEKGSSGRHKGISLCQRDLEEFVASVTLREAHGIFNVGSTVHESCRKADWWKSKTESLSINLGELTDVKFREKERILSDPVCYFYPDSLKVIGDPRSIAIFSPCILTTMHCPQTYQFDTTDEAQEQAIPGTIRPIIKTILLPQELFSHIGSKESIPRVITFKGIRSGFQPNLKEKDIDEWLTAQVNACKPSRSTESTIDWLARLRTTISWE